MRPHVLWFDESYDEPRYRFESALRAAVAASLLVVVGTSGAAAFPVLAAASAAERGTPLVDVDPEANPFGALAASCPVGCFVQGQAASVLPDLAGRLRSAFGLQRAGADS
jgi:NAD-dependent deacetylase